MKRKNIACYVLLGLLLQNAYATCINIENISVPVSTPTSSFSVLTDGTVLAPKTKLMWMRCLVGQTLINGVCTGSMSLFAWEDALNAAKAQTFAGHSDWRLPNIKELVSILEDRCSEPSLNSDLFPISDLFSAWSSTPSALYLQNRFYEAWKMDSAGNVYSTNIYVPLGLLLVRDAP